MREESERENEKVRERERVQAREKKKEIIGKLSATTFKES